MSFSYRPAVREKIGLLLGVAGPSGSGKTFTALQIAQGIVTGPDGTTTGTIGVIDTEGGRALHYAPPPGKTAAEVPGTFDFLHMDFPAPFTPERYVEAVKAMEAAGVAVIVLDSTSHEWAGEGGCSDLAMLEAERMAKVAAAKAGQEDTWPFRVDQFTAPSWKRPKLRHQRMMAQLIQTRCHLIMCLRAQEKVKITGGRVIPIGYQPICEKAFMFELSGSFMLHPENPGCPDYNLPHKLNDTLQTIFPKGERVGVTAGRRLRVWADTGAERKPLDRVQAGVQALIAELQDADRDGFAKLMADAETTRRRDWLRQERPELSQQLEQAISAAQTTFGPPPDDDTFPGDLPSRQLHEEVAA